MIKVFSPRGCFNPAGTLSDTTERHKHLFYMKDRRVQRSPDSVARHGGAGGRWNQQLYVCAEVSGMRELIFFFLKGMMWW